MRKYLSIMMLVAVQLILSNVFAIPANPSKTAFSINGKSLNQMQVQFTLPQFTIKDELLGAASYQRIELEGADCLVETGMPELPFITTSIAVPAKGGVSIEVVSSTQRIIPSYKPYPVQDGDESAARGIVVNDDYYRNGGSYPEAAIQYSDPQIMRDLRIVTVQINPFSYNAQTRELTIHENIQFRLSYGTEGGINELAAEPEAISPTFASMYESTILNYNDYRGALLANIPPRILIIYGNSSDNTYLNAVNQYALWKRQKGADVDMASTAAGEAGSSTTTIKNYIQARYNNTATKPDFVVLIGDTSGSYAIPAFSVGGGGGDYPYTHLSGTDLLGDCFIGRISAEDSSQLLVILDKIYKYERDISIPSATWLNKMLLVGDWEPSGISTVYISKYIKEMSLRVNPEYTFTELYGAAPAPAAMNTAINQGIGFFSFRGYIGMSNWSPSASLVNGYMLPHAVIITCATGNYSGGTATTESFIRLGSTASQKGAVTAIGMSTSSTHTTFNNVLHGGIFDGIFGYGMRTMGEAILHGKLYMNQIFGVSSPTNVQYFTHWCNLMGDPTMEVFVGIPSSYQITAPASIPVGSTLLDVVVRDQYNIYLPGQCVTLSFGSTILARGFTDSYGLASLILPTGLSVGTAVITVSGHNYKPLQQNISILATGLITGQIIIDDDNSGSSAGNGNGLCNSGETLELTFALQNTTGAAITALSGLVSSSNQYVSVVTPAVNFGTIMAGSTAMNSVPVVVSIGAGCPDLSNVHLVLSLSSTNGSNYSISEHLEVYNGRLSMSSQQVIDGDNSALDPDEQADIRIILQNTGSSALSGLSAELICGSNFVSIMTRTVYYGSVAPGNLLQASSDFQVYVSSLCIPGMVIPMTLNVYNDLGYQQSIPMSFSVGTVSVTDPLGPDEYGYVIYDIGDTSYADCPVYNWVGIAPAEGGSGTQLAITDSYNSGDEGDQVGADALEVVTLPFRFSFYGVIYEQITVCSNGFIALGVTENAEFRNFRLPGAMGPSPMIAPFWDDLATGTNSRIYTFYDSANYRYIIEWYRMLSGANGSSEETFQVILYNQRYVSTSTGDGPILFQYKTFNNVDAQSGSEHGSYSTIGIENHTGTVGLEYTFNNQYPTAAAPLANFRSLYITTLPVVTYGPNLTVLDVQHYDTNENGYLEPGEMDYATIILNNIGNMDATNVSAVISSTDPYVTIQNATVSYPNIPALGTSGGNGFFQFSATANCPQDHTINFVVTINSNEGSWLRSFSITVHAPVLLYQGWAFDDFEMNHNGLPDAGETGSFLINLLNETVLDVNDVVISLSESSEYISFTTTQINCGTIGGGAIFQASTTMVVSPSTPVGTSIPVTLQVVSSNTATQTIPITIVSGVMNYSWDFEANNGGFTVINNITPGWEWGTSTYAGAYSGTKVWGTVLNANHGNNAIYQLITPTISLSNTAVLTFRHRYHAERSNPSTYWDGGQVHISQDFGSTWTLITPVGGYPVSAVVALGNQPGYSGEVTTWQLATFNLGNYAGQNIKLRWYYASDQGVAFEGWFVDDIAINNGASEGSELAKVSGGIAILRDSEIASWRDYEGAVVNIGEYYLLPESDGTYKALIPAGTYQIMAIKEGYRSTSIPITLTAGNYNQGVQLSLEYLPVPENVSWMIEANNLSLRWTPVSEPSLGSYRVYTRNDVGTWNLIASPTGTTLSLPITASGHLRYKITARYNDGWESLPDRIIDFTYPYNGSDVQPQEISEISVSLVDNDRQLNWLPVTMDTLGNPITVWNYRIYAGNTPSFECLPDNLIGSSIAPLFVDSAAQTMRFYKVKALLGYALPGNP